MTRTVPGSGAVIEPIFDEIFGVRAIKVKNGGEGYDPSDPPRLTVDGCGTPDQEALLYPIIDPDSGKIIHVRVLERGKGYDPLRLQFFPEQETPTVIDSFDLNRIWQGHPNSPTTGIFDSITDRIRIQSDNHPKPTWIQEEAAPGGGSLVDRTFDQTFIYRGGKDVPDPGTRVEQSNKTIGILANGGLFHTPEWGTEGGAPVNFAIDSVKYNYIKNNGVYDDVTDGNVRYYQSSKLINEFALSNGVFEWGKFKHFTWTTKVEGNIVLNITNTDETLGTFEVGRTVDEIGGTANGEITKVVRDGNNVPTRIYLRNLNGDSFEENDRCLGSTGFSFTVESDPISFNAYYIEFGPDAAKFGPFSPGTYYFAPENITVKRNYIINFNQSDSSNNNHPIRFSITPDGTHNDNPGTLYYRSTGASAAPAADYEDEYAPIFMMNEDETSRIYYYCKNHPNMSGQDGDEGYIIISTDTSAETLTNNYYAEGFFQPNDASTIDRSRHIDGHSKVLGMSFDGYPIYGPFGYRSPDGLTISYTVTVASKTSSHPFFGQGSGKGYYINGGQFTGITQSPVLTFVRGATYTFNQNDASNTTHAIYFSEVESAYGGVDRYETGVVYTLDGSNVDYATYAAGHPTATNRSVSITVASDAPNTLYYACQAHGYMGASINVTYDNGVVTREISSFRLKTTAELPGTRPQVTTAGTVTYAVTVSNNEFLFDGSRPNFLSFDRGKTIIFNQNDASNNANFLLISATNDGWHSTGNPSDIGQTSFLYELGVEYYIDGSAVSGFAAYLSAFNTATTREIRFTVPVTAPTTLYVFGYSTSGLGVRTVQVGYILGDLVQDYIYDTSVGTLDEFNGKFAVTPEYPNGTYAYFMSEDSSANPVYPYAIGPKMYGVPLFEGSVVPDVVDLFPDGAAGDIVLTDSGTVSYVKMSKNGDNYYGPAKARILGGEGSGATGVPTVQTVTGLTLLNAGRSYATAPTVIFEGGGGQDAQGSAKIDTTGKVTRIDIANAGEFYQEAPFILITGGGGIGAKAVAAVDQGEIVSITVTDEGEGYTSPPKVIFTRLVDLKRKAGARQANNSSNIYITGLTKAITPDATEIFVKSTSSFPGSGNFIVGYETISYTAKTDEKFSGLTRGVNFNYDQRIILDTSQDDREGISTYKFNVGDRLIRRVENSSNKISKVYDWNPATRELLVTFEIDELAFIDGGIAATEDATVQFDAGVADSSTSTSTPPNPVLVTDSDTDVITLLTVPISTVTNRKFEDDDENDGAGDGIPDLVNTGTLYENQINLDGGIYNSLYGIEATQGGTNTTLFAVGDAIKDASVPFKFAGVDTAGGLNEGTDHPAVIEIYLEGGSGGNFSVNEVVTGGSSGVQATVVGWDATNKVLQVQNIVPFNTGNVAKGEGGFLYQFSENSTVTDFYIQSAGTNYTGTPTVAIEDVGDIQCTGTVVMTGAGDQVASITINNGGYGITQTVDGTYNLHPTVTFTNASGDTTGAGAVAYAILGGELLDGTGGASYRIKSIDYLTGVRS
tara:strand:- start:845 stop:5416 length:4572 start_codon:yes stop_codon:yes gene_type:complete